MAIYNPTSNTTPDGGLGGGAVTTPSNTGHASTTSSAVGDDVGDLELKSCGWSGFSNPSGSRQSVKLQFTHTSSGSLSGGTALNAFSVEYSVNNGAAWNTALSRANFTASQGPTLFSVDLSASQDLSLVKVRDSIEASAITGGDGASAIAEISNIQIVVQTANAAPMGMM